MLNASHLDPDTLGIIHHPHTLLGEAMAVAFFVAWFTGLIVYVQAHRRRNHWIPVGLYDGEYILYESIYTLYQEWRYYNGRWIYPSREEMYEFARDFKGLPFVPQ